jgi:hypothetical protein
MEENCGRLTIHEVHRRTTLFGFTINKGVGLDKVSNVRDVNTDLDLSVGFSLDMNGIIKLVCTIWVDRESFLISEITSGADVFLFEGPIVKSNTACDSIRELIGSEVVVSQKRICLDLQFTHLSELFNEGTERMKGCDWPSLDASNEDAAKGSGSQ